MTIAYEHFNYLVDDIDYDYQGFIPVSAADIYCIDQYLEEGFSGKAVKYLVEKENFKFKIFPEGDLAILYLDQGIKVPFKPETRTNLQKRREAKNLSQTDLAKASGVHINVINRIERGERESSNLTLDTAVKLAKALDCHAEEIFDDEDSYTTRLRNAKNALRKDNISDALISNMTDHEILTAYDFDDYDKYNQYLNYLARKYDI